MNALLDYRRSFRARLALLMGGGSLVLVLVATLVIDRLERTDAERAAGEAMEEIARQVASQLDRGLFERHREVRGIAQLPSIRSDSFSAVEKRQVLEQFQQTYPLYAWLGLAGVDGAVVAATAGLLEGESVRERTWFAAALQGPYLGDVRRAVLLAPLLPAADDGGAPRFVDIAAPVLDAGGRTLGVIGAHLNWEWARDIEGALLAERHRRRGIEVLVLDHEGKVLLGPPHLHGQNPVTPADDEATLDRAYVAGQAATTGYRDTPGLGWTIVARQPAALAFAAYDAGRSRLLAGGVLTALLLTVLTWAAADHIARPLRRMAAAAEAVRSGRADRYASKLPARGDELGRVDAIFTAVVDHLRNEQQALREEIDERRRLEAQRDALFADVVAARQEAVAAHERLSEVVERINDGIVALDRDWHYTFLNRRAAQMLGRDKPEDLLGKHIWTEYPEGVDQPFARAYQRALAEQQPQTLEQHYAPWDLWFENRIYPSTDGLTIFFTDVTTRKQAEAQLRESEMRFRATFEQAATGIALLSLSGRWLQVNERLCAILGYTHDELLAVTFQDVTDADDLADDLAQSQRVLAGEIAGYQRENRCLRKDGHIVWINLSVALVRNTKGKPAYFIAVVEDIDARKRAEQAAMESEARFHLLVDAVEDYAIYMLDAQGCIASWNRGAERIHGYAADEVIGHGCSLLHPEAAIVAGEPQRALEITRRDGRFSEEGLRRRRDGTQFWAYVTITAMHEADGQMRGFAKVVRDISARRAAEAALQQAMQRLRVLSTSLIDVQEAERKRVSRELHDEIGQSLTAVKIVLQTSAQSRSCGGCPELADAVAITDRALEHVRTLSRNLRPPQLDDLGLVAALRAHAHWVSRHGGLPIHFTAAPLPAGLDDQVATACFRIAQEAITNVQRHARASAVWLELQRTDGGLLLSVRDDGRGFDPAAATADATQGKSLGVLSMQERCELVGGRLELISAPGAGSTVRASFPAAFRDHPLEHPEDNS